MGLLNKLMFWKKEEDSFSDMGLGKDDLGSDPFGSDPFAGSQGFGSPADFGSPPSSGFGSNPFSGPGNQQGNPFTQPQDRNSMLSQQAQQQFNPQYAKAQQPQFQGGGFPGQNPEPDFSRPFTMSAPQASPFPSQSFSSNASSSKDMELISSKMDSIKSSLDIINQRLANLERMYEREEVRKRTGW